MMGRTGCVYASEVREGHSLTKLMSLGSLASNQQPFKGRDRVVMAGFCPVFSDTARISNCAFRCLHDFLDPTNECVFAA